MFRPVAVFDLLLQKTPILVSNRMIDFGVASNASIGSSFRNRKAPRFFGKNTALPFARMSGEVGVERVSALWFLVHA